MIGKLMLATMLSTGVEMPEGGSPGWSGGMQWTVMKEKRPAKIESAAQYLKWKWRMDLSDPKTGLDNRALREGVKKIAAESKWKSGGEDWYDVAARCFEFLTEKVALGFSQYDYFPAVSAWERHSRPMNAILWGHAADVDRKYSPGLAKEIEALNREGRAGIWKDFDHSAPDWDVAFKLGFPGLKERVDKYPDTTPFYRAEKRTAAAIMKFLDRLIATAKAHPEAGSRRLAKQIASLERLRKGPPQTTFDVMQFTMVYFILSEPLNYFQVRTMGNIDRQWWPYYKADLEAGRTTEAEFREEFKHFLWQFGSIDNYWGHPIYLGGVDLDGEAAYNPMSMLILDVVEETALPTPKFQLKFGKRTPDEIWAKAHRMLQKHAPLVLMSEDNMMRSMKPVGLSDEECKDLLIWGCFEYLPRARGNCTGAGRIALAQPVTELMAKAAKGEFAAETFAEFKEAYFGILKENCRRAVAAARETERHLAEINPALVLTLTVKSALEKGEDAFATGFDYNYTAINEVGFGTAVDSLLAVQEFVYEKRAVTLGQLGKILAANWEGHEELRLRMKRSKYKWGCGNKAADALAKEVIETFSGEIVGKPNGRGGKFTVYGLQSRGFLDLAGTPATPNGRKKGEHLSKNMAPSVGAETEGMSGSLRSYSVVKPENFPCGSVYDFMMHPSVVGGESGLPAFRALVEQFFEGGGVALNLNIVSAETLRDAQAHPDKYENLQVRVAGWNIRWNDIPRREQNEYIERIESMR